MAESTEDFFTGDDLDGLFMLIDGDYLDGDVALNEQITVGGGLEGFYFDSSIETGSEGVMSCSVQQYNTTTQQEHEY